MSAERWKAWPTMCTIPLMRVVNSQHMLCMYVSHTCFKPISNNHLYAEKITIAASNISPYILFSITYTEKQKKSGWDKYIL